MRKRSCSWSRRRNDGKRDRRERQWKWEWKWTKERLASVCCTKEVNSKIRGTMKRYDGQRNVDRQSMIGALYPFGSAEAASGFPVARPLSILLGPSFSFRGQFHSNWLDTHEISRQITLTLSYPNAREEARLQSNKAKMRGQPNCTVMD